jgi:hypothetical protein
VLERIFSDVMQRISISGFGFHGGFSTFERVSWKVFRLIRWFSLSYSGFSRVGAVSAEVS